MDATGADMTKRGALADEFLPLLRSHLDHESG